MDEQPANRLLFLFILSCFFQSPSIYKTKLFCSAHQSKVVSDSATENKADRELQMVVILFFDAALAAAVKLLKMISASRCNEM